MNAWPLWLDIIVATLLLTGAGFAFVGSLGLYKLPDFLRRLHGPTKATTLGVGCILIASMLVGFWRDGLWPIRELLITVFLIITAPVSGMLLARAFRASEGDRGGES